MVEARFVNTVKGNVGILEVDVYYYIGDDMMTLFPPLLLRSVTVEITFIFSFCFRLTFAWACFSC